MRIVESSRSRLGARAAAFALIAASVAGCSADSTRFKESPFASPMAARPAPAQDVTGGVVRSSGRVDAQPLPPPPNGPMVSSTGAQAAPYRPAPNTLQAPGTRVAAKRAPEGAGRHGPAPAGGIHVVARGENLQTIGRRYGKTRTEIAKANHLAVDAKLRVGQRVAIPGIAPKPPVKTVTAPPAQPPAKPAIAAKPAPVPAQAAKPPAAPATKVVANEATPSARIVTPAAENPPAAAPETTGATPTFRWPVRGRVIGAFGTKTNGQQNDGINLSVPEGTSVKAAEDGVVAYAGNELKGYGNLVLVRHSGGFVTAYAHASEVMVKRGDHVKRGQIIAKAGQTGSVSSPQVHFEIRKGSTPVDPMQHLSSGT